MRIRCLRLLNKHRIHNKTLALIMSCISGVDPEKNLTVDNLIFFLTVIPFCADDALRVTLG